MIARQFADNATGVAKDQATANRVVATNQPSLTALAVGVHATAPHGRWPVGHGM
jgi:hypothetical protein